MTRLYYLDIVRARAFRAITLIGMLTTGYTASQADKLYGTTTYPVTYALIEVIEGDDTSPETTQAAVNFAQAIKKQPITSADVQLGVRAEPTNVLPNGDFYVEGSKVLLVNSEENHLYLSGVVRPVDLLVDNSVASSRVAEAQVDMGRLAVLAPAMQDMWNLRRSEEHTSELQSRQ